MLGHARRTIRTAIRFPTPKARSPSAASRQPADVPDRHAADGHAHRRSGSRVPAVRRAQRSEARPAIEVETRDAAADSVLLRARTSADHDRRAGGVEAARRTRISTASCPEPHCLACDIMTTQNMKFEWSLLGSWRLAWRVSASAQAPADESGYPSTGPISGYMDFHFNKPEARRRAARLPPLRPARHAQLHRRASASSASSSSSTRSSRASKRRASSSSSRPTSTSC